MGAHVNLALKSVPDGTGSPLRVAVCVATRNRRVMLARLLTSLSELLIPDGVSPLFVIVENNQLPGSRDVVDGYQKLFDRAELVYILEPEIGIPFARNRAKDVALENGADLILFVDDDETVAADWLMNLVAAQTATGCDLVGGPVYARFDEPATGILDRILRNGIRNRFVRVANRAKRRAHAGNADMITVVTSNWLGTARLFTDYGLCFDTNLRFSGGSDTKFCREVRAKGLHVGWAPDAHVYETIPAERLSLSYQFQRGLEQSKASASARISRAGRLRALPAILGRTLASAFGLLIAVIGVPLTAGDTLVDVARAAGKTVGPMLSVLGYQSNLYAKTTGH